MNDTLFVITARGGSKGIPGKNIKPLGGKPLICYAIDVARALTTDEHICVSTDAEDIEAVAVQYGLPVPFLRPAELSGDRAGSYEVLLHALAFYQAQGITYKKLVLLQPTSPFRTALQVKEAIAIFNDTAGLDMVVSVKESKDSPYFNLFEENENGFLRKSKPGVYTRRQDSPTVYAYNGAVYVINTEALQQRSLGAFEKVLKYEMSPETSVDIDTPLDWLWAEFLLQQQLAGPGA